MAFDMIYVSKLSVISWDQIFMDSHIEYIRGDIISWT